MAVRRETLVFYESPVRVLDALADISDAFGKREAFLCREATKLHEEYLRGSLTSLHEALASRAAIKGEIVLVVSGGAETAADSSESVETLFRRLTLEGRTRREAVKHVARSLGIPARELYRRVLGD